MTEITAHRGFCDSSPENTLEAMIAALAIGVDWIELDVQSSSDGVVVVFHDTDLVRAGESGDVREQPWARLAEIDVSPLHAEKLHSPFRIPRLSDVLQLVRGKVRLNLELKYHRRDANAEILVRRVWKEVAHHDAAGYCTLTSFNARFMESAKELPLPIGLAMDKSWRSPWRFPEEVQVISADFHIVDEEFVGEAHRLGKEVHVWTVNEASEIRRLIDLRVDNVITDRADVALSIRNS